MFGTVQNAVMEPFNITGIMLAERSARRTESIIQLPVMLKTR